MLFAYMPVYRKYLITILFLFVFAVNGVGATAPTQKLPGTPAADATTQAPAATASAETGLDALYICTIRNNNNSVSCNGSLEAMRNTDFSNIAGKKSADRKYKCVLKSDVGTPKEVPCINMANTTITAAQAQQAASIAEEAAHKTCALISTDGFLQCLQDGTAWLIDSIFVNLASAFLSLAGGLFDFAFRLSVVDFQAFMNMTGAGDNANATANGGENSLYSIWRILRNVFNVVIAFTLIRIALFMILKKAPEKIPTKRFALRSEL